MKTKVISAFFMTSAILIACGKDEKAPEPPNRPPEEFSLITVTDKESGVNLKPEFSWKPAVDPDGDKVTYTIYLEIDNESPKTKYTSGLEGTTYTPEEPLYLQRPYYWKVVADDGRGGQVSSPMFSFRTRGINKAIRVTPSARFPKRFRAVAVNFKDKLWLIGGRGTQGKYYNDVWQSPDGKNWFPVVGTTGGKFAPRDGHTVLVFMDKIWVIGGRTDDGAGVKVLGDVWHSDDGGNWKKAPDTLPARYGHQSLVYDGKMWVIGGYSYNGNKCLNDVWYSSDGANWTRATGNAAFPPRAFHSAMAYKGKMYVLCGWQTTNNNKLDDIWVSTDGKNWEQSVIFDSAQAALAFHTSLSYGGNMFLIGGATPNHPDGTIFTHSLWHYNDKYVLSAHPDAYGPRRFPAATVFNGKVWVIGGYYQGLYYNDVWYFE